MRKNDAFRFSSGAPGCPPPRLFRWIILPVFVFISLVVYGQEPNCADDIDCSSLSAEIELIHSNVSTDCSVDDACGGGDNFRQIFYKVRLKYRTTSLLDDLDFYLDYDAVAVAVSLLVDGTAPLYSRIDIPVTENCYVNGPGMNWGDTSDNNTNLAIFSVEPYAAAIDFQDNLAQEDCGGDKIHFTQGSCTGGDRCAYADLFIIAVNAYPDEIIQLKITDAVYDPATGAACDLDRNYPQALTVATPDAPSSEPGDEILAQLAEPEPKANGGCDINVVVTNTGSSTIFVGYMEFVVKVSASPSMPGIEVSGNYNDPPLKVGNDYYIRFISNNGHNISGNSTLQMGTITLKPPIVMNEPWEATAALVDDDKSRLKAFLPAEPEKAYCSRLLLDPEEQSCSGGGAPCDYDVRFKIWPPENASANCPSEKIVRVGLTSPTLSTIDLRRLAFELRFDLSDGAEITGADVAKLCLANEPAGCYDFMGGTEADCWKTESNGVFKFCFDVSGEEDPVTLDVSGDGAYLEIEFNTGGCINGITPVSIEMIPDTPYQNCPLVLDSVPSPFQLCEPQIFGQLATEQGKGLSDASVTLTQTENSSPCIDDNCPPVVETTGPPGNFSFCPCLVCSDFEVAPYKNNDPLNGVSTFDLVLINKHILGLDTLDSPYKIFAADANNTKSITTFDIVEIRKLILGIYDELPNNTSWRFVDEAYQFPNPANPFFEIFPETVNLTLSPGNPTGEANFVAVKVGDVNGSAVPAAVQAPVTTFDARAQDATQAGQVVTLPLRYAGEQDLEAFQLGLRFDPARLELIGPSQGDLPGYTAGNFGLGRAGRGEIRTLWFANPAVPGEALHPGDVLFYLSFRARKPLPAGANLLETDDELLSNAAWSAAGQEFSFRPGQRLEDRKTGPADADAPLQAACFPNPATGETRLAVRSDRAGRARLAVFGPFGRNEWMREVTLSKGEQTFDIPEIARLPAGVYFWKVLTPWGKTQGHLIKQ
ncbi:MAG: hypothetical protein L6Q97_07445 [Thermoanaerobaculia bacterium]|nr:hypothetical protein [Thermoanaerobaculia bacterium]